MGYYSPETQALADLFPASFRLRQDPFSVGQQVLNPAGQHLADFKRQLRRSRRSCSINTFPLDTLDQLYRVYLGPDFTFARTASDPRIVQWRRPTITGTINLQPFPVGVITTLEEMEDAIPSRLTAGATVTLGPEILGATPISQLASADFDLPSIPGRLYLTLAGTTNIGLMQGGKLLPIQVFLSGITTKGTTEDEIITFPGNLTLSTRKHYQQVLGIKVINANPDATLALSGAEHVFDHHLDPDFAISVNRQDQYVIWDINGTVLNCQYFIMLEQEEAVLQPNLSWQLQNENGQNLTGATVMSLMPGKNYFAAVNGKKLFFYDKRLEYPPKTALAHLQNRTDNCQAVIDADTFFALPGDTFSLRAYQPSQIRNVTSYFWQVAPPGQNLQPYKIVNGSLVLADDMTQAMMRNSATMDWKLPKDYLSLDLNQVGYWAITLTTTYQDGSQSTDARLIGALAKTPMATFAHGLGDFNNVFTDDDGRLCLMNQNGAIPLKFFYDLALVDYEKKLIYLRDRYDAIEVTP